jgi:hypothetical protein
MKRPNLAEQIKAAGYKLKLTDDWQQVLVSGDSKLLEPLRSQLKANQKQVRTWLMAVTFVRHLEGKITIDSDVPPIYWTNYPREGTGHRDSSVASLAHQNRLMTSWLGSAGVILAQRDEKGRLDATSTEINTCIVGLRSFHHSDALAMVNRLEESLAEAKKCSARMSAAIRRKLKRNRGDSKGAD